MVCVFFEWIQKFRFREGDAFYLIFLYSFGGSLSCGISIIIYFIIKNVLIQIGKGIVQIGKGIKRVFEFFFELIKKIFLGYY